MSYSVLKWASQRKACIQFGGQKIKDFVHKEEVALGFFFMLTQKIAQIADLVFGPK